MGKSNDNYFAFKFKYPHLHKKGKGKSRGNNNQKKPKASDSFVQVIFLGLFIMIVWLFMFVTESTLSQIKLINIIMTLGGLETYDQSVIGFGIIVFLMGMAAIAFAHTPKRRTN